MRIIPISVEGSLGLSQTMKNPNGIKVLVAEDSEDIRELIVYELVAEGFTVQEASGGNEALRVASNHTFDLVVSDIQMPNGSGLDLIEKLKSANAALPVILMSGNPELFFGDARIGLAEALLTKPLVDKKLSQAIYKVMGWTWVGISAAPG